MEKLSDYFPYENTAEFDFERLLKWSNATIVYAIDYCKKVSNEQLDYDTLVQELLKGTLRSVQALLFGALKAADHKIDIKRYTQIYKPDNLAAYVTAVMDGMAHYMPDPEIKDTGKDLDDAWPDTQAELKKKASTKRRTGASGSGSAKKKTSRSKSKR